MLAVPIPLILQADGPTNQQSHFLTSNSPRTSRFPDGKGVCWTATGPLPYPRPAPVPSPPPTLSCHAVAVAATPPLSCHAAAAPAAAPNPNKMHNAGGRSPIATPRSRRRRGGPRPHRGGGRGRDLNLKSESPKLRGKGILPVLTTGQLFLHSWRHFLGLHLSSLTMAIRVSRSAISSCAAAEREAPKWRGRWSQKRTTAAVGRRGVYPFGSVADTCSRQRGRPNPRIGTRFRVLLLFPLFFFLAQILLCPFL